MQTLHLKTSTFEVTNTVYNHSFNLNVELMRYILIKEKLNMPKARSMLYEAYMRFYNSTSYDFEISDPFLFLLHKSRKDSQLVESYNQVVKEILKELEIYKSTEEANKTINKIDGLKILIQQNKDASVTFAIYYHKRKIFFQKIYSKNILFPGSPNFKHRMLAALLRYEILGFLNNASAAVQPETYKALQKQGYSIELFASFYNASMKHYFGLFYDLEHPFGCLGNLFTSRLSYGKFVCNPPFEIHIMNQLVYFLKEQLDSKTKLTVYITVPVWYKKDREKLGKTQEFSDFRKDLLEPYIIEDKLFLQKDYKFYSYLTGKYDNLCDVNNFIISNF